MRCCFVLLLYGAWGALLVMFFVVFGRLVRRFEFAVSWLCECRLSHLVGGVNKKTHCPAGGPQIGNRPGACGVPVRLSRVGSEDVKLVVVASRVEACRWAFQCGAVLGVRFC